MPAVVLVFTATLNLTLQATAKITFLLGTSAHLAIRPFEIDSRAWTLILTYFGVLAILLLCYVRLCGLILTEAAFKTFIASLFFNSGFTISMLLYRAFFHRLHHFPGPFLGKLSRFYAMSSAAKSLKTYNDIQKLHQDYGDFVRVGPREISINRKSAIRVLYEAPTQCPKSPWYSQVSDDAAKTSIHLTRDVTAHKDRKKAWMRGLGSKALALYEDRIAAKIELLLSRIAKHKGEAVNITQYSMYFGFDVMGDVGFSKDFDMLKSDRQHPAIQALHDNLTAIGILGTAPWLPRMLSKIPGAIGSYSHFAEWCSRELLAKRVAEESRKPSLKDRDPVDIVSWLLRAEETNDRSAPPGERAFQEDSRVMIVAGSDTTAVALANALYFLTKTPTVYRRLQAEIRANSSGEESSWSYDKVRGMPYLDWIIYETLRLKPSVPAGLTRLTPADGIWIDEVYIPGDTIVSVPAYTIHRNPRYWDDPLDFRPERWEKLNTEKAPWIVFSRGQFGCPGRNLALLELRMVLSRVASRYSLGFAPGEDGERFDRDAKDAFTLQLSSLHLIFTPIR